MENFKLIVPWIPKNVQNKYIRQVFKNLQLGHLGEISIKNYRNKKTCIVNIINLSQNGYDNLFLKLRDPNNKVEIDTLYGKWVVKQFTARFKETIVVTNEEGFVNNEEGFVTNEEGFVNNEEGFVNNEEGFVNNEETDNYYGVSENSYYDALQFYPLYFDNGGIW